MRGVLLLMFLVSGATASSGCIQCLFADDEIHSLDAELTTEPGDYPIDITNTTVPDQVRMRDAVRAAGPEARYIHIDSFSDEDLPGPYDGLYALAKETHGKAVYTSVIVDGRSYLFEFSHADGTC